MPIFLLIISDHEFEDGIKFRFVNTNAIILKSDVFVIFEAHVKSLHLFQALTIR